MVTLISKLSPGLLEQVKPLPFVEQATLEPEEKPSTLTTKQVAHRLGCDTSKVRRLIESGQLDAVKSGKQYSIFEKSVHEFTCKRKQRG